MFYLLLIPANGTGTSKEVNPEKRKKCNLKSGYIQKTKENNEMITCCERRKKYLGDLGKTKLFNLQKDSN